MRHFAALLAVVGLVFTGAPALADTNALVEGVNGVVTAPVDMLAGLAEPHRLYDYGDVHEKLAVLNHVTDRVTGVTNGVYVGLIRLALGLVDVVTFPLTEQVDGPHSPDARYRVIGGGAAAE